ncbi:DGKE (predicted) [Pycnogonum litorale]
MVQVSFYVAVFMVMVLLVVKWYKRQRLQHYDVPARDITKGHRWCCIDIFSHPAFCNICQKLMVDGAFCDSCGVCADHDCTAEADKQLSCKSLSISGMSMKHHWIHGNLPLDSICGVCEEDCGDEDEPHKLSNFKCCWCQQTVHSTCRPKIADICDFGQYRDFIVPPTSVKLKLVGWKGRRHLVVGDVTKPPSTISSQMTANECKWRPLIVVGNRKSGDNEGQLILQAFRRLLNPLQVIDLYDLPPENAVVWCHLLRDQICRILIAGGDGTVGWVLNTIENFKLEYQPHVCILPLGTGNDLSRVFGWGESYSGDVDVQKIISDIAGAKPVKLDRWKIKIKTERLRIPRKTKEILMTNYASVGVDALVTLNFHKTRESKFYLYGSRLINKFLYLSYGTKDILERECKDLHKKVDVELDGRVITLPELEAIVVLNIPSWGAGVRPWTMGQANTDDSSLIQHQRIDDGRLEVFGVYSSFHIAQLQVGLSEPIRIGQAETVTIRLHENVPMQVDGEPWEQHPAEITITHHKRIVMLQNASIE